MVESLVGTTQKAEIRLLKLLAKAETCGIVFHLHLQEFTFTHGERVFTFAEALVKRCLEFALVRVAGDRLVLTIEGRACLRRILHPIEPFLAQHSQTSQKTVRINGDIQTVAVNENESPLARLFLRKSRNGNTWINELEFRAGERLREDFEKSRLQPRISANWVASVASGSRGGNASADISDFAIDARRRMDEAVAAMGPDLAGVALDMCCFLKGLETIERERLWPPRSAKLMLRTALRELVRHYRLKTRSSSPAMAHWGTEDFRPAL